MTNNNSPTELTEEEQERFAQLFDQPDLVAGPYLIAGFWSVIVIVGFGAGVNTGEWHWFSRAGSALVAFGVYYTWLDLTSDAKYRFVLLKEMLTEKATNAKGNEQQDFQQYIKFLKGVYTKDIRLLRGAELFTLISGTLIWGFGDLVGNYF